MEIPDGMLQRVQRVIADRLEASSTTLSIRVSRGVLMHLLDLAYNLQSQFSSSCLFIATTTLFGEQGSRFRAMASTRLGTHR